jgi:hypothetical protein
MGPSQLLPCTPPTTTTGLPSTVAPTPKPSSRTPTRRHGIRASLGAHHRRGGRHASDGPAAYRAENLREQRQRRGDDPDRDLSAASPAAMRLDRDRTDRARPLWTRVARAADHRRCQRRAPRRARRIPRIARAAARPHRGPGSTVGPARRRRACCARRWPRSPAFRAPPRPVRSARRAHRSASPPGWWEWS